MESRGNVTRHRPVRELAAIAAVAVAMAPIALPGFAVWPPTAALVTLCALLLVAVPVAAWGKPRSGFGDCATAARDAGDANGRMLSPAVLLPRIVAALDDLREPVGVAEQVAPSSPLRG